MTSLHSESEGSIGSSSLLRDDVDRRSEGPDELSLERALSRLEVQLRLKDGAENMLQVLDDRLNGLQKDMRDAQRVRVVDELNHTNYQIATLQSRIDQLSGSRKPASRQRSDERLDRRFFKESRLRTASSARQQIRLQADQAVANLLSADKPATFYVIHANELAKCLRHDRSLCDELFTTNLVQALLMFSSELHVSLGAAGFRLLRYFCVDSHNALVMLNIGLDLCLIEALAVTDKGTLVQEEALRLVRALVRRLTIRPPSAGLALVRAVLALADGEARLGVLATETLAEMLTVWPDQVIEVGGLRCLVDNMLGNASAIASTLVKPILWLLERSATRNSTDLGQELGAIYTPFTTITNMSIGMGVDAFDERRTTAAISLIVGLTRTWSGLVALSFNRFQGLSSVIESLRVPDHALRNSVLDLVFEALSIPRSLLSSSFLAGGRLIANAKRQVLNTSLSNFSGADAKVSAQLAAYRLMLFLELGLLDTLVVVMEDGRDRVLARKATLLASEALHMTRDMLPIEYCRRFQSLATLFEHASQMIEGDDGRLESTRAIFQIDSLTRMRDHTSPRLQQTTSITTASETDGQRGQRQVEQVKIKMGILIDDSHFRNLLLDTHVLSTKNFAKWNWDTLNELVQGPLLNPKRLEESIKATKFMKRLLAFFRPFNNRFSDIKNTRPNQRYIRLGCTLIETLLTNVEGVKYLFESKLLRQLSECLAQLDPMAGIATAPEVFFSRDRLRDTLSHGYFAMLGVLSAHTQGSAMLERWRVFTSLYRITDLHSRHDLVVVLLTHLQYSNAGHARIMLAKALTTGVRDVRLFATMHLGGILLNEDRDRDRGIGQWAMRLLVNQLYDPNDDVCCAAVDCLQKACKIRHHLEYAVELRPALDHLGDIGNPLLVRFLATRIGFSYLLDLNYIDRELEHWHRHLNVDYVHKVEQHFAHLTASPLPYHFYGELAKTDEGCRLLKSKGHLPAYVDILETDWSSPHRNDEEVCAAKAALWAIGNVGAEELGISFLIDTGAVDLIVDLVKTASHVSLRGTAYLVLGLIARTQIGVKMIESHGWHCVVDVLGRPGGVCIPRSATDVFMGLGGRISRQQPRIEIAQRSDAVVDILLGNLSNHILANDAAKKLLALRQHDPSIFNNPELFARTTATLAQTHYRLAVRNFILRLFPRDQLRRQIATLCLRQGGAIGNGTKTRPRSRTVV
ncbi:hypothetical protein PYCC9005_003561 [Savitreella phatthalungensis]